MSQGDDFKDIFKDGFLSDAALSKAEEIASGLRGLSTTKMRQYFDDLKGLRRIIESGATAAQIKVKLHLIKSRAHYDIKRIVKKQEKAMSELKDLLVAGIDIILKSSDVLQSTKDFSTFFENLYGYFYAQATKKEEE
ncbi:MAG: type III-A CRISPR-associated protein Csm2 [candidate division WOR-3 bacterium]